MSQGNKSGTACGDGESCAIDFGDDDETDGVTVVLPTDLRFLSTSQLHERLHQMHHLAITRDRPISPIVILPRAKD